MFGVRRFSNVSILLGFPAKVMILNEVILNHHTKDLIKQKELLSSNFDNWRGDLEQVDDVCVMGIKI